MTCNGAIGNRVLGKRLDKYTKHLKNMLISPASGNYTNNKIDQRNIELNISLL